MIVDDDIFRLMNGFFGDRDNTSEYIDYKLSERIISDDNIYFTIVTKDLNTNEIDVQAFNDHIDIHIYKGTEDNGMNLEVPYQIIPDNTKVSFKSSTGILDIITYIDKDVKSNRIEIKE